MLEALKCLTCSSTDLEWQDGFFVCKHCGTKHIYKESAEKLTSIEKSNGNAGETEYQKDPQLQHSLDLCMTLQCLKAEKLNLNRKLREASSSILEEKHNLVQAQIDAKEAEDEVGRSKGISIIISIVLWLYVLGVAYAKGLSETNLKGIGIIFLLWIVWGVWRIFKLSDQNAIVDGTKIKVELAKERMQKQQDILKNTKALIDAKQAEIDKYIENEMSNECIVPKEYWDYHDEIRKYVEEKGATLDEAIEKLKLDERSAPDEEFFEYQEFTPSSAYYRADSDNDNSKKDCDDSEPLYTKTWFIVLVILTAPISFPIIGFMLWLKLFPLFLGFVWALWKK